MVDQKIFDGIYQERVCLVTGHTGFKGSWLCYWLTKMGAKVIGFSLEPETEQNHFTILNESYTSIIGDIRDAEKVNDVFQTHQPEIVFHLAAQALVRYSYEHPIETFDTNIIGTVNVFEACRSTESVRAIVNVTSDKCYDNKEWIWGYRENDPIGGHDPYSASKGCSELVTASYQKSFFNKGNKLLASGRAGNVIGGGDWAVDRLLPDLIRSTTKETSVNIRNPYATRPWQHVLEPLSGYLVLGWKLFIGDKSYAEGWNFGPELDNNVTVSEVIDYATKIWDRITYNINDNSEEHHEANLLMLDCSKAAKIMKWTSVWNLEQTMDKTINWYKDFYELNKVNTHKDLVEYIECARSKSLVWAR